LEKIGVKSTHLTKIQVPKLKNAAKRSKKIYIADFRFRIVKMGNLILDAK